MANDHIDERFFDDEGKILPEYRGFNVGACLLSGIWGVGNNTYIALLIIPILLIPIVRYLAPIFCIWLGFVGNRMAIKNKRWGSPLHFLNVQRRWAGFGIFAILSAIIIFTLPQDVLINNRDSILTDMTSGFNGRERIMAHQKAYSTLVNEINMSVAMDGPLDLSQGTNLAQNLSQKMSLATVEGDTARDVLGIRYKFNCNGKECVVYVDINGNDGPNRITKSANNVEDIMEYKIVDKNGNYTILTPEWFKDMMSEIR